MIAATVALSSVSIGGNRKVSARIMTESTERSRNIKIKAAIQTDRILVEAGDSAPSFSYEPTGIIDLPPGHRGYGSDERIEMSEAVDQHNERVLDEQTRHGRLPSTEEMGSRLKRGAWKAVAG